MQAKQRLLAVKDHKKELEGLGIQVKGAVTFKDGKYSVDGHLIIHFTTYDKLPVQFDTVTGNFTCNHNNLISLEGAPKKVGGTIDCWNNTLTNLYGAPETVGGDFGCNNNKLISVKGAPETIEGNFDCLYNFKLGSLDGLGKVNGKIESHLKITRNKNASKTKIISNKSISE